MLPSCLYRLAGARAWVAAGAAVLFISACGGGDLVGAGLVPGVPDAVVNPKGFDTLRVFGDDLSDIGAYGSLPAHGRVFTIDGKDMEPVWVEAFARVDLRLPRSCSHFNAMSSGWWAVNPACHNFAVGGARIPTILALSQPVTVAPGLGDQLRAAATQRAPTAKDLYVIQGGQNDLLDLWAAHAQRDSQPALYRLTLENLLSPAQVASALLSPQGAEQATHAAAAALAQRLVDAIEQHAIRAGAQHVALMNVPDLATLPRVKAQADLWANANANANLNATRQADALRLLATTLTQAFNQALAERARLQPRILLVDLATALPQRWRDPRNGLTQLTEPACPVVGRTATQLPKYDLSRCTFEWLRSTDKRPSGSTQAPWWDAHLFADDLHYSLNGHAQVRKAVHAALARAGWAYEPQLGG